MADNVGDREPSFLTEKPAFGKARHVAELDPAGRGRIEGTPFPAGDCHGGIVEMLAECGLGVAKLLP